MLVKSVRGEFFFRSYPSLHRAARGTLGVREMYRTIAWAYQRFQNRKTAAMRPLPRAILKLVLCLEILAGWLEIAALLGTLYHATWKGRKQGV